MAAENESYLNNYYQQMILDISATDGSEIDRLKKLVATDDLSAWILRWPRAMSALAVQLNPSSQILQLALRQKEAEYSLKRRRLLRKLIVKLQILEQKTKALQLLRLGDAREFDIFVKDDQKRHQRTIKRRSASRKKQVERRATKQYDKTKCLQLTVDPDQPLKLNAAVEFSSDQPVTMQFYRVFDDYCRE